jgi:small subunit ribosomal protein S16
MLKIRLRRVGKKNQPSYRIVVVEHTAPVQGSYLELLGNFNPRIRSFTVKQDRVLYWLDHGAKPSERMAKLLKSAGLEHKQIVLPDYDRKPKSRPKKAALARAETAQVPKAPAPTEAAAEKAAGETEENVAKVTAPTEEVATDVSPAETSEPATAPAEEGSTPQAEAENQTKEE